MERERRLRKKREIVLAQRRGKWWAGPLLVLRALPNQRDVSRFGFVVSGRVGKAVVRNRVRRRLKEIVRQEPIRGGWDLVFVAREKIAAAPFPEVQNAVRELLRRGRFLQDAPAREQP